jgi:simple sugar transport system permease protein
MLRQPFIQKEGRSDPISKAVLESAELPRILGFLDANLRLHAGIFIMLAAVAVIYWLLFRSKLGFAFRISGENPGAARYAGIRAGLTIVMAMAIAGALEAGGRQMQVDAGVSIDMIGIIQALIIMFVAAPLLVRRIFPPLFRERRRGGGNDD